REDRDNIGRAEDSRSVRMKTQIGLPTRTPKRELTALSIAIHARRRVPLRARGNGTVVASHDPYLAMYFHPERQTGPRNKRRLQFRADRGGEGEAQTSSAG